MKHEQNKSGIQFQITPRGPILALERSRNQISHGAKTASSVNELLYELFVRKTWKKIQVTSHAYCFRCHVYVTHVYVTALSLWGGTEKPMLAWLSSYADQIPIEARNGGQQFNSATMTSETGKKANCSALPLQIKYIEMSIRSSDRSTFSHLGFPHLGPWQHLGATMDSTLDKREFIVAIRWEPNPNM